MIDCLPFQIENPVASEQLPTDIHVWSQLQYDLLQTLAVRLRMMSVSQVKRLWTNDPSPPKSSIRTLCNAGLLERYIINAHPLLHVEQPLARWKPGLEHVDSRVVSGNAKSRWTASSIATEVVVVSRKAANLFGSNTHGLPAIEHRDHDLLLADAFIAYRSQQRSAAYQWVGEAFLAPANAQSKAASAFLIDRGGHPIGIVHPAGRSSVRKIESFQRHCVSMALPYEIW